MDPLKVAPLVPVAIAVAGAVSCYQVSKLYFGDIVASFAWYVSGPSIIFGLLFLVRYLQLLIHCFSYWILYKPVSTNWGNNNPKPQDCTVVIPSVDPNSKTFIPCLESVLLNGPRKILIVTLGSTYSRACNELVAPFREQFPSTEIDIQMSLNISKRFQIVSVLTQVYTEITILLDDHVYWPSANFLTTALAGFKDEAIGAVGVDKCTPRNSGLNLESFWNMMESIYFGHQNFEERATTALNGEVFIISSLTGLYRTVILRDPDFRRHFVDDEHFSDLFEGGPADGDNFITRWVFSRGWNFKIQQYQNSTISVLPDTNTGYIQRSLQRERVAWRRKSASFLFERSAWKSNLCCKYATYVWSIFNCSLLFDPALIYTLTLAPYGSLNTIILLLIWILLSKTITLIPYLFQHPQDILMLPGYFALDYCHVFIRLYAGLTSGKTANNNQSPGHPKQKEDKPNTSSIFTRNNSQTNPPEPIIFGNTPNSISLSNSSTSSQSSQRGSQDTPSRVSSAFLTHSDSTYSPASSEASLPSSAVDSIISKDHYRPLDSPHAVDYSILDQIHRGQTNTNSNPSPSSVPSHRSNSIFSNQRNSNNSSATTSYYRSASNTAPYPSSSSLSSTPSSLQLPSPISSISTSTSMSISSGPSPKAPIPPSYPVPTPHPSLPIINTPNPDPKPTRQYTRSTYTRSWVRSEQCRQLHYEGCKLTSCGGCLVEDLFDLGRDVVAGRPRF